ncbi:gamma-glutamyltransferase [Sphingomonas sp. 1P06PA]|uniref:gamma-glutamyltransferase n=1 Tax=Sphingomonas sp. 1P06PA TaxID=554121 RepID=UPI0039A54556
MMSRLLFAFLIIVPGVAHAAGGVVSAADPRAAAAGQAMLRQGGSATDAAMAMMLALTVVEPQSSGIGGGGFLVHHDAATGRIETIDGRETAPASAGPTRFLDADGKPLPYSRAVPGGFSVGVPGNIRLMAMAHAKWGKLPWATLFQPAITLAEDGFTISGSTGRALASAAKNWNDFPEARAIWWADGKPRTAGSTIRLPKLARLLETVAKGGPDAFYAGDAGEAIVRAVATSKRNPTALTMVDLAEYRAKPRAAVCGAYRGYRICGMGPPSSGATTILQMLGMIERFDIPTMGSGSAVAWHLIGEAMQLAYADREKWLGDRDFVEVPVAGLIDPNYLRARSRLISPTRALARYEAGTPPGAPRRTAGVSSEVAGTTHFVAVDGEGDVASMTSTIEGPFGSQLMANGFFLNNELTDFTFTPQRDGASVANRVQPGKRPLSSMSPTIVYDSEGKVVLAVGSAGGKRIIMHVMKTLVGFIDWKLPAAQAIALPNLYFGGGALLVEKDTPLAALAPAMTKLGQTVTPADLGSKLNAVERVDGGWRGAADPRGEGVALNE